MCIVNANMWSVELQPGQKPARSFSNIDSTRGIILASNILSISLYHVQRSDSDLYNEGLLVGFPGWAMAMTIDLCQIFGMSPDEWLLREQCCQPFLALGSEAFKKL